MIFPNFYCIFSDQINAALMNKRLSKTLFNLNVPELLNGNKVGRPLYFTQ